MKSTAARLDHSEGAGQNQREPLRLLRRLDFAGALRRHRLFEHLDARGHLRRIALRFGGGDHPIAFDEQLRGVKLFLDLKKGVQRILRDFVPGLARGKIGGVGFTGKSTLPRPDAKDAAGANNQKVQTNQHAHSDGRRA